MDATGEAILAADKLLGCDGLLLCERAALEARFRALVRSLDPMPFEDSILDV